MRHFRGSFEPRDIQLVPISDGISKWEKDQEALLKHYQAIVIESIAETRSSATGSSKSFDGAVGLWKFKKELLEMMLMSFLTISVASGETGLHFIRGMTFVREDDVWLGYFKVLF
jgi:hypothetical protein